MNKVLTLFFLMLISICSFAQESNKPVQVSFAYPLGTNGINAKNISNTLSFNLIYGKNGGVRGFELGGVLNENHGNVSGAQYAGVSNMTYGSSSGIIISGVYNMITGNASGVHFTGVYNQFNQKASGIQMSGVLNMATNNSSGLAFSGVTNIYKSDYRGLQFSVVNLNNGTVNGMQMGVVNKTKKIKGLQIGIVNIADDADEGACLGLINLVKMNRYSAFEVSFNESGFLNGTYKLGTHRLYTLYRLGATYYDNSFVIAKGLGLGSRVYDKDKYSIYLEASSSDIDTDFKAKETINLHSMLCANIQYKISEKYSLQAGMSFNAYYTEEMNDNKFKSFNMPYTLSENINSSSATYTWIGASIGIIF